MDSTKTFEFKVGIFTLIGICIIFVIVFSVGDVNFSKAGYRFKVTFNFASGIGSSAPVRLAGVGVGNVQGIRLIYDDATQKTKAELTVWVNNDAKIEEDAEVTINTLGLLGEKYLEILPGTPGRPYIKNGAVLKGNDPVSMEKVTTNLAKLSDSVVSIAGKLERGEGTIGKLLTDDTVYNNLVGFTGNLDGFTGKLNSNQGTLGKLVADDGLYKQLEELIQAFKDFAAELKTNPWKLLFKPR